MEKYLYSAAENAFYPSSLEDEYKASGSWPEDGLEVENSVFFKYSGEPPIGKVRIVGNDNFPAWGDIPPLTHEEFVAQAEATRARLVSSAKQTISIWQSELLLGEISDEDKASLKLWIAYIKNVLSVDISQAPDVSWPATPEE